MSEQINEVVESQVEDSSVNELGDSEVSSSPETVQDLQSQIEEAIEDGATQEEVVKMVEEFKLKVNGKEVTKTIDWNDKESLKKELQLAAAGREAMQESSELKKVFMQAMEEAKERPDLFLQELGIDPEKFAEELISRKVEEMQKSPEQLEKEKMQYEIEELRKKIKDKEEREKRLELDKIQREEAEKLDNEISSALDAHKDLAPTEFTVKKIADAMIWAINNGYEDVTAEDVIPVVKAEMKKEFSQFFEALGDDALETYIGQKNIERMRQKRLKKMKKAPSVNELKKSPAKVEVKEEEPRKKQNLDSWMYSR